MEKVNTMREFVEFLVKHLVDHPDEIRINELESERSIIYELHVAKSDMGKVLGKKGRTAHAMRTLINAAAGASTKKRVMLEIIE